MEFGTKNGKRFAKIGGRKISRFAVYHARINHKGYENALPRCKPARDFGKRQTEIHGRAGECLKTVMAIE